jgi:hypothetical protein
MSNELFVELNDEQQELVSGGISFDEDITSDYSVDFMKTDSLVVNGPGGSASVTKTYDLDLDSSITKDLDIVVP